MTPTLMLLATIYLVGCMFSAIVCVEGIKTQGYLVPFDLFLCIICILTSWVGCLFVIWDELTVQDDLSYFFMYYKLWEAKDGKDS